jgi:hypothetical protein
VNLLGRNVEAGLLEDLWQEPPEEIYALTRPVQEAPDAPEYVEVEFENGRAGAHEVGRIVREAEVMVVVSGKRIALSTALTLQHPGWYVIRVGAAQPESQLGPLPR